jgi:alpha-aminoadipic semialdehyde synthase
MNEIGLDPGIDHLLAMRMFDRVKSDGARVHSFVSWCGGLPAPEVSNNPLGYKFSWSPRGVLTALLNPAKFKRDGKMIDLPEGSILKETRPVSIFKGFNFEGYPNRDSLKYVSLYNLDLTELETMFRGTLRYRGFADVAGALNDAGLLSVAEIPILKSGNASWAKLLASLGNCSPETVRDHFASKLKSQDAINAFNYFDLFSTMPLQIPSGVPPTPLDVLSVNLAKRLVYEPGERDLVCLHHEFGVTEADGKRSTRTSTLVAYGDEDLTIGRGGYTAMAKTVALPAAIVTDLILQGVISGPGVRIPTTKDVYQPTLQALEQSGLHFIEK